MSEVFNVSKLGVVRGMPERLIVHDDFVSWESELDEYHPPHYTAEGVLARGGVDADFDDMSRIVNYADSATGRLQFDVLRRPLNPLGRTGLTGLGVLWYGGPNVAGDLFESRGLADDLEITTGRRKDNGKVAISGGFQNRERVKAGPRAGAWIFESPLEVAIREHEEELAIDLSKDIGNLALTVIYRGVVRNSMRQTDNAWIETNVYGVDVTGTKFEEAIPVAGDDFIEGSGQWCKVKYLDLDAMHDDHGKYIRRYVEMRQAAAA